MFWIFLIVDYCSTRLGTIVGWRDAGQVSINFFLAIGVFANKPLTGFSVIVSALRRTKRMITDLLIKNKIGPFCQELFATKMTPNFYCR